jgi:ankyrin repeat protein
MLYKLLREELMSGEYERIKEILIQDGTLDCFVKILIQENDTENIQKLVDLGFNINTFFTMSSPLMLAVELGNLDMIRFLISIGADPNLLYEDFSTNDEIGYFALDEAAVIKNREIYDYLFPLTKLELQKFAERTWKSVFLTT